MSARVKTICKNIIPAEDPNSGERKQWATLHIQIHTYTHTHTYIHTYIQTYTHRYIDTYIHTYIHTYTQTDRQTDIVIDQTLRKVYFTSDFFCQCFLLIGLVWK